MKALAKLKDDARKHEQKEEWEKAIEAYVAVLKNAEGGGEAEAELPLYNRVGDLFVRLGRPIDAVTYYESAADHYAEAGLFNNAIALCNKALRYLPSRLELLRKLGQFSAAQGFITDARRWYLEYAERQLKQGALDDAFRALEDFAQVHEDAEIRELLGRHLYAHNRPGEALAALNRARELRVQAGEMEVANRLAQEILSLDPTAKLDVAARVSAPVEPAAGKPPAPVQEPTAPPTGVVEHAPISRSSPKHTDLPGLPEPEVPVPAELPGVPEPPAAKPADEIEFEYDYDYESAREDADVTDAPITSDTAVFAGSEPDTVDALATFDGGSDDSTGGLEAGLIDLDSIPDINMPFDLETTSLSLGGEVPVIEKKEFPPVDLPFLTPGMEPLESKPEPELFGEAYTDFTDFGLDETLDATVESPSFLESEVGFEADVDFTEPLLQEKPPELETQPYGFEYEEPPVSGSPSSAVEETWAAQEEQWLVEGLEQDPEPISFNEMIVEESASGAATIPDEAEATGDEIEFIEPEPAGEIDYHYAVLEETRTPEAQSGAAIAEAEPPRFSFEDATYPGVEAKDLAGLAAAPAKEPVDAAHGATEVADELIEPETIEAADEFFAQAVADTEELDELAEALLEEPLPDPAAVEPTAGAVAEETLAEVALDGPVTERESFRAEAEIEAPVEQAASRHEPIPGWEPPTPPGDIEPVLPPPEPALLNGASELARIRRLILAGDAFAAAQELEALHPKLAASGQMREAWEATNALLDLDPTNQRVLQQRVEYAAASGDLELGLRSYLEFGRFLQRTGAEAKAGVIFQRVLDLDPHNPEARAFMKAAAPPKVTTGYVDLLALLDDDDEQSENTRFMVAEKPPTGDEERDFADMLAQFKQKVAENVSLSESGAHYDLGLAFKEMGLVDEAIAEFQVALKGGEARLKVYEELGQCFLLKQQYTVAVTVLNRALTLPVKDDSDLLGVYYSLGRSYEELGRPAEARSAYERVVGFDIGFRDASERLARL